MGVDNEGGGCKRASVRHAYVRPADKAKPTFFMEIRANLNHLHIAPRKVRLIANLLKGMDVSHAKRELQGRNKRANTPLLKLLQSGAANAGHNFQVEEAGLYIKSIQVNPGPVLKRSRPRAFGRAAVIRKRTSHVALVLATKEEQKIIKTRKQKPIVRDAHSEDQEHSDTHKKYHTDISQSRAARPQTAGFIKRTFRRKSI